MSLSHTLKKTALKCAAAASLIMKRTAEKVVDADHRLFLLVGARERRVHEAARDRVVARDGVLSRVTNVESGVGDPAGRAARIGYVGLR